MTKTIRNNKDGTLDITVELTEEDLVKYVVKAEEQLVKRIDVKGFRKGNVPKDVMRKKLGEDVIKEEALMIAVYDSMLELAKKENLDIIDQYDLKIETNTRELLKYSVTAIVASKIDKGLYTGIEIEKKEVKVTDEEVNKIIEDIRKSRAKTYAVDRGAEVGDYVLVDILIKHKDKIVANGDNKDHPIIIGQTKLIPGLEPELIGMKSGQFKTIELDVSDDYYNKELTGKKISIELKVKSVQARELPDVTDDFVRGLGQFDSVPSLRENIFKSIDYEKQQKEEERVRVKVVEKIIDKTKLTIPDKLVERQLDAMMQNFDQELHSKGMELGLYLSHIKKTQDELRSDWKERAKKQVQMDMIIRTVAFQEGLSVSTQETEDVLARLLKQVDKEQLKDVDSDRLRRNIYDNILSKKVFGYLLN